MLQIDNVDHAIGQALEERLDLSHMAVTAWRRSELTRLGQAVARALGTDKPELSVDDVIGSAIVGTASELVASHTRDKRHLIDAEDLHKIEDEYLALIAKASGTQSSMFLRQARRQISAALNLSLIARLDCVTAEQRYKSLGGQRAALSFVVEVDQYLRDYKQQCGLADVADLLTSELEPIDNCALCLLDPVGLPLLALLALRRLLPRAQLCHVRY